MTAMRQETTSEHIARDMREGRFPERSDPQMVADQTNTAPERIYMKPNDMYENGWSRPIDTDQFDEEATEYIRADLAATPAIDPAAIRESALRDAAAFFDADSNIAQTILALIGEKK